MSSLRSTWPSPSSNRGLGADFSGFARKPDRAWSYEPKIAQSGQIAAYAVDVATAQTVRYARMNIWRAVYTYSNSAEE